MKKYITLTVDEAMQGMTIEKILRRNMQLTRKQISRAKFRPNGICKNGIQCRVTESVASGDKICVCVESDNRNSDHLVYRNDVERLHILYEDEDLLAVNKPSGMLTHPSGMHYSDSLSNQVAAYFAQYNNSVCIRPVGRLDKETSGIVLFAKNQIAAQRLQKQREEGSLQKTYMAITAGTLPVDTESEWHTIRYPIKKSGDHPLRMESVTEVYANTEASESNTGLLSAVTHYQVIFSTENWSVVILKLDTGRTHQIRVHMKAIGHPILGDSIYSEQKAIESLHMFDRTALHAWKVSFMQPFSQKMISLEASFPEDFEKFSDEIIALRS